MDQHRPHGLRAAVAQRQRSQGRLRAVTATVGVGGVATAGAVAFILPGATHASATERPASTPRPSTAASSQAGSATSAGSSGAAGAKHARRHRHHHHRAGQTSAGSAGTASAPSAPAAASSAPAPAPSTSPPQTTSGGS